MKPCLSAVALVSCIVAVLFSPTYLLACSCGGVGPPCQQNDFPIVFTGRVIGQLHDTLGGWATNGSIFRVAHAYRGLGADTITIWSGGPCAPYFTPGDDYLVYAGPIDTTPAAKIGTHLCTRTERLDRAGEDIAYLNEIAATTNSSHIHGTVRRLDKWGRLVAGSRVYAESESGRWSAVTDQEGNYDLGGLPDGIYRVISEVPNGYVTFDGVDTVVLKGHGCAAVNIDWYRHVEHDGDELPELSEIVIEGALRDRAGQPVQGALVDFIGSFLDEPTIYTIEADRDGSFTLRWYQDLPVSLRGARTLPNGDRVVGEWRKIDPSYKKRVRVDLALP